MKIIKLFLILIISIFTFNASALESCKWNNKKKLIRVGYCKFSKKGKTPSNNMIAEINGNTAIEIVNTLIREKFISTMQHAADMGIELHKAELSLKYGFKYIQDKDLFIDK